MTDYDRHTLMQMAARGAPVMLVTRCVHCGALISPDLEALTDADHLIVIRMRYTPGPCHYCQESS